jgi:hypothetical protein
LEEHAVSIFNLLDLEKGCNAYFQNNDKFLKGITCQKIALFSSHAALQMSESCLLLKGITNIANK